MTSTLPLPESCGVGFKEWAGVCDALGSGRQSLILRKGGIAEGPGGFAPEHPAFWLYPTHVHEADQGLRTPQGRIAVPTQSPDMVEIQDFVIVEFVGFVADQETLPALQELHEWTAETVLKRFRYRQPGLWALGVRVYRRPAHFALGVTPEHAGCRTWVFLEPPLGTGELQPVLVAAEHNRRMDYLRSLIASRT